MSFMSELYTWVNAQTWVPDNIAFDVHPENPADPYYTMTPVTDGGSNGEFCASETGMTIVEFNGYGTDKTTLYDIMDELRVNVKQARNQLPTFSLWNLRTTGVIGFATEDVRIYRYAFTLETQWRLSNG